MSLADRTPPTTEEFRAYRERFSNWGRWGEDDQFGALNLITPEVRAAAAATVREGRSVSLSYPLAVEPGPENPEPVQHEMRLDADHCSDFIGIAYHGRANTHLDALCHVYTRAGGELFGGRSSSEHITMEGATTLSVDHWREGIVTRGVLYDIPRLRGVDHVTADAPVHGWELADAAAAAGIEPRAGDAVVIRSGAGPFFANHPGFPEGYDDPQRPGVHASCAEFFHAHDASLLVWDLMDAPMHNEDGSVLMGSPLHRLTIPYLGMPLLDNAQLEDIAAACAEAGRWEFMLVVAPLVVPRGTGSPVNPIAVL